jgi:hypothetical protein
MQLGYVCVTIYAPYIPPASVLIKQSNTAISSRFLRLRGVNVGKGEEMERWGEEGRGRLHDDDRAVFAS